MKMDISVAFLYKSVLVHGCKLKRVDGFGRVYDLQSYKFRTCPRLTFSGGEAYCQHGYFKEEYSWYR